MSIQLISYEVCYRIAGESGLARRAIVTVRDEDIDTRITQLLAFNHMNKEENITLIATLYCRENTAYTIS